MQAFSRHAFQQRLKAGRSSTAAAAVGQQDEGYWAYMQRQIQERTEKLGIVGDSMGGLEEKAGNLVGCEGMQKEGAQSKQ